MFFLVMLRFGTECRTLSMTSKEINIKCISNDLNTNNYPENVETDYFE